MARSQRIVPAVAVALLLLGCASPRSRSGLDEDAWVALTEAKSIELLSLKPEMTGNETGDVLYGYKVLSRAKTSDAQVRKKLVSALEDSVLDEPVSASCFMPRHALVATHDGHKYELLICFSCGYIRWFVDGKQQEAVLIGGSGTEVFNEEFTSAGLTIAP